MKIYSNKDWMYTAVPKCASSIIISTLKMKQRKNPKAKQSFTFIRLPFARLKSYLYQKECLTEQLTEEKIKSILNNFDGFNENCVPYSVYIKKDNFNFIGTLENFYEDWKTISDIDIEYESERETFDDGKLQDMHNTLINKYSNELSRLYSGDFALYSKVTK